MLNCSVLGSVNVWGEVMTVKVIAYVANDNRKIMIIAMAMIISNIDTDDKIELETATIIVVVEV